MAYTLQCEDDEHAMIEEGARPHPTPPHTTPRPSTRAVEFNVIVEPCLHLRQQRAVELRVTVYVKSIHLPQPCKLRREGALYGKRNESVCV